MHNLGKLFNNLPKHTIETLLAEVPHTIKSYEPQDIIFNEMDFSRQLGILLKGEVQTYKTLSVGNELLLNHLHTGALLGIGYVWGNAECFPVTIKAVKSSSVLFLPKSSLKQLFLLEPIILDNFLDAINDNFEYLNNKIEMLAIPSAKDRLLFAVTQSYQDKKSVTLNKSKLCQELSISRASLYRSLEQLEHEKYIEIHDNGKITLNPSIMKQFN